MILVVKDYAEKWIEKRNKEIEASTDKQAIVDIAKSFERLYCRNIVYICFGEDISETEVEIEYSDEAEGPSYKTKKVNLSEAIMMVLD